MQEAILENLIVLIYYKNCTYNSSEVLMVDFRGNIMAFPPNS
jgi:hypothetical protein